VRRHPGCSLVVQSGQNGRHDVARRGDGIDLAGRLQLDHRLNSTGITMTVMVRVPLTPSDHERGERLGRLLRQARGERSIVAVAGAAGISAETLRKIETGRIPTPAFFTVAALALTLGLSLDALVRATGRPARDDPAA